MITRVPREPERPDRLHRHSGRETGTDNSQAPLLSTIRGPL